MSPKLSVVVPFHNTEEYFRECLESLAGQTLRDLEVVLVDDGSTDNGAVIAKELCARDPRFRLVAREHEGPGPARNAGVRQAKGSTWRSPTPTTSWTARPTRDWSGRWSGRGPTSPPGTSSGWTRTRRGSRSCTKVSSRSRVRGRMCRPCRCSCGTVRRGTRSTGVTSGTAPAWNSPGFYEDPPVTARAHALARSVDVLSETVYYWRKRPGSITEDRYDWDNISQRMRSAQAVRDGLAATRPSF